MIEYIEREAALESVREKVLICESLPDTIAKDASLFTLASMNDSLNAIPAADARHVVLCRDCWFFKKDLSFCSLHEADFAEDAFCSYATTDGLAEYWGLDKEDHDRKRRESGGNHFCADREKMEEK